MTESNGFESLGAVKLNVWGADRIVVGILEENPGAVALALGSSTQGDDTYFLIECEPARARDIAEALTGKANAIEARSHG